MKALLVAAVLAVAGSAQAEVRITVDPTAPFTERDLAEAVRLRWTELPPGDVVVRVGRLGLDQLLVVVGDKTEAVSLPDRDRAESARVVAVIVTSLVEGDRPPGDVAGPPPPPAAPGAPNLSLWSVILGAGVTHESIKDVYPDGLDVTMVRGGVARVLAPNLRAIADIGYGLLKPQYDTHTKYVPVRLGIESMTGRIGLEAGGQMNWYSNDGCNKYWGHSYSIFGAVKMQIPIAAQARLVLELGGHYVVKGSSIIDYNCLRTGDFIQYGGAANASLEWAL